MARYGVLLAAALLFQANPCAALLCYVSTRMPIAAADAREGIDETISGINARPRKPMTDHGVDGVDGPARPGHRRIFRR